MAMCVSVCTVAETDSVVQCHHAQEDTDVCKECSCQARYVYGCLCIHAGCVCDVCGLHLERVSVTVVAHVAVFILH